MRKKGIRKVGRTMGGQVYGCQTCSLWLGNSGEHYQRELQTGAAQGLSLAKATKRDIMMKHRSTGQN